MILLRKQRLGNGQASIAELGDGKPDSVGLWSRTRLPRIAKLPLNMADRSSLQTIALLTAGDSFRFLTERSENRCLTLIRLRRVNQRRVE